MTRSLADAFAELRRDPTNAVRVRVDDLDVELRAVAPPARRERLGTFLASLGQWEGEPPEALLDHLPPVRGDEGLEEFRPLTGPQRGSGTGEGV